jgi:hypothetical protein
MLKSIMSTWKSPKPCSVDGVADTKFLSWIQNFCSIPDSTSRSRHQEQQGRKKNCCPTFSWANLQIIKVFFTPKIVTQPSTGKLSEIRVEEEGSEIRKKSIPEPGSGGVKKHRIRNTVNISATASIMVLWIRIRNFLVKSEQEKSPWWSNRLNVHRVN